RGKRGSWMARGSSECRILRARRGDFGLEPVADGQELRLGHDVLAATFEVVLVHARFDDRVDRAALLAEAAEDALEQIDVVASRAARAVLARRGVDRDRERGAHGLAQLARDA